MIKSRQQRKKKGRFETAGALALGRARIERAPAALGSTWRWARFVLVSALVVSVAATLWVGLDDRFYVYRAEVTGVVHVSPEDVFQASGLKGLHILWARPTEIEARILAALPNLESVDVTCALPARCAIAVVERQPKTMWDEDGQLWWVDAEGVIFPAGEALAEGWLVRGPLPRDENGRLDERVRVALAELWAGGADVAPVLQYVPSRGLLLTDARGWRVFIGQGPGTSERLRVLVWLAADLQARGIVPRFVDVRFPDAPYYSLVNDW
jgi:cell division protein FtsQ